MTIFSELRHKLQMKQLSFRQLDLFLCNCKCRSFRYIAAVLFILLFPFILISPAWSEEPLVISLSHTPLSLPFYVADSLGYFAAEGVKLKINNVIGGHRTLLNLLDGTADLATSSDVVVMFNSFKHSNFAVIATFVTSDDDTKIVTRTDTGISLPRHLAGKRVGTVIGGSCHYYLDMLLLMNGIDPKGVKLHNLQPEAMAEALKNGEVDAIAIWEPFPYKALKTVPNAKVMVKSNAYRMTFNLIVHKKYLGVRDDELVKLLRALDRATQFINTQPQKAQAILCKRLQLDNGFVDWIWPSNNYRLTLDQSLLSTLEGEARWARQEGLAKGERSPNYLDFVYVKLLSKIRPAAVSIR